jgi:hypothetical protein
MGAELDAGGFGRGEQAEKHDRKDTDLPRFGALIRR